MSLRVILASTPVAPLGDARAGGVDRTVRNAARALRDRGHHVTVVAPLGSAPVGEADALVEVAGSLQAAAQGRSSAAARAAPGSVLAAMWQAIATLAATADAVVNLGYDVHPFEVGPLLPVAVGHHLTLGPETPEVVAAARRAAERRPGSVATYSRAQAAAHGIESAAILGIGLDLALYPPALTAPERTRLAWAGRVVAEKQPSDAIAVAEAVGCPLDLCGEVVDAGLLEATLKGHPGASVSVHGQLGTAALARVLGAARTLLMTPRWFEALGIVGAEALACGTPVTAYRRGGVAEVVDAATGVLVPPDDVTALAAGVAAAAGLDRRLCRRRAEEHFSLGAYGARWEAWLGALVG